VRLKALPLGVKPIYYESEVLGCGWIISLMADEMCATEFDAGLTTASGLISHHVHFFPLLSFSRTSISA